MLNERSFKIETNLDIHPFIWLTSINKYKSSHDQYGNIKLLFNQDYVDFVQPIVNLIENVFLPKEILPKIQALEPRSFLAANDKVADREYGKAVIMTHRLSEKLAITSDPRINRADWGILHFGDISIREMTLSQFIKYWDDLIITSTQWVAQNSSYQDLNIPFFRNYYYQSPKKSIGQKIWDWLMADAF
jgi:hypothetical protein